MSERSPALLIVALQLDHDEGARYHIDETLTIAGISSRLIAQQEEHVSLESVAPFVIALHAPCDPKTIDTMAQLVTTGFILDFSVKGEIVLAANLE